MRHIRLVSVILFLAFLVLPSSAGLASRVGMPADISFLGGQIDRAALARYFRLAMAASLTLKVAWGQQTKWEGRTSQQVWNRPQRQSTAAKRQPWKAPRTKHPLAVCAAIAGLGVGC